MDSDNVNVFITFNFFSNSLYKEYLLFMLVPLQLLIIKPYVLNF